MCIDVYVNIYIYIYIHIYIYIYIHIYILLTSNHMIFLVQFAINKHMLIFSKTTNCTRPTGSSNFVGL